MNTRTRQIIKAIMKQKRPDWIAFLHLDGCPASVVVFVPRGEVEKYKARYGDRIEILYDEKEKEKHGI